jgi:hypothetical protein
MAKNVAREVNPFSRAFGTDKGTALDRFYIEAFIKRNQYHIIGKVLEVGDSRYTDLYGKGVSKLDVLSISKEQSPAATLIGNLETGEGLPENEYDCFICTQVLQFTYQIVEAAKSCMRVLKPGGALLLSVPGISQISMYEYVRCGEYWRFTDQSIRSLFGKGSEVEACGNFYACSMFLAGLPIEMVDAGLLLPNDTPYQMVITAKVIK